MQFRDLALDSVFVFSAQVGFSLGAKFIKLRNRKYQEWVAPGRYLPTIYKVGTVAVEVKACLQDSIAEQDA